jgi:hypothetical protein
VGRLSGAVRPRAVLCAGACATRGQVAAGRACGGAVLRRFDGRGARCAGRVVRRRARAARPRAQTCQGHASVQGPRYACALEYNVVRWGETELPPEAGVAVYVRGQSGKLAAVRIYDDADPRLVPVARPSGLHASVSGGLAAVDVQGLAGDECGASWICSVSHPNGIDPRSGSSSGNGVIRRSNWSGSS